MSTRLVKTVICDRCQRVIGQCLVETPQPEAPKPRLLIQRITTATDGTETVEVVTDLEDLCLKCDPAVQNLLARIRLADEAVDAAVVSSASRATASAEVDKLAAAAAAAPKGRKRAPAEPVAEVPAKEVATETPPGPPSIVTVASAPIVPPSLTAAPAESSPSPSGPSAALTEDPEIPF